MQAKATRGARLVVLALALTLAIVGFGRSANTARAQVAPQTPEEAIAEFVRFQSPSPPGPAYGGACPQDYTAGPAFGRRLCSSEFNERNDPRAPFLNAAGVREYGLGFPFSGAESLFVGQMGGGWRVYGVQRCGTQGCQGNCAGSSPDCSDDLPLPPQSADYSAFAQDWGRHGFNLNITEDGVGEAQWRIYRWCSDAPIGATCDAMTGNIITAGGRATIIFSSISSDGSTASGVVIDSTDQLTFDVGPISFVTLSDQLALLVQNHNAVLLCGGPDAPREAAQIGASCGA